MGIFSFLKSVGEKITGNHEDHTDDGIAKALNALNLGTEDVKVDVADGKAVLNGSVKDRATLEKMVLAVGNTQGIESVDADKVTVTDTSAPEATFYTVKSGDTLWKIAETQYGKGHGDKNTLIFDANKPMLKSPDKIYPGQVLRIPPLA